MRRAWLAIAIAACGGGRAPDRASCAEAVPPLIGHVGRCDLGVTSYRVAIFADPGPRGDERTRRALTWLVDRELLAQAALDAGEQPPNGLDVRVRIKKGEAFAQGNLLPVVPWIDDQGFFDAPALQRYIAEAGVSVDEFVAEQGREQLAQRMILRIAPRPEDRRALDAWLLQRCREAKAAHAITIDPKLLAGFDPCP